MHNFSEVEWGSDEARGDRKLQTYFVPIPAYEALVLGKKRYIVGRKGTGKSAILERIRIAANNEHQGSWKVSDLSLRHFPLQLLRDLRDKSHRDKAQFVPVWTFLIAIELARLVTEHLDTTDGEPVRLLRRFVEDNFDKSSRGFADTVARLRERSGTVQLGGYGSFGTKSSAQISVQKNYQEATRYLLESLRRVASTASVYILIDDLDEGYRSGDQSLRLLLLALLRAVEDVATQLASADPHYRFVVALRDDIFDSLEDADLNKLDDHVFRLKWSSDGRAGLSLRDVVDARIRASLKVSAASDPWSLVVVDGDSNLPERVRSEWGYLINRTYQRPRDIVKFLKYCQEHGPKSGRLKHVDVIRAEEHYSAWLYRELRDEMQSFLPVWKEVFQCISQLGVGVTSVARLKSQMGTNTHIASWMKDTGGTLDAIFAMLFDYGVIGSYSQKRVWSFKYKDEMLAWDPRADNAIVHWGLVRKLRVVRDIARETAD